MKNSLAVPSSVNCCYFKCKTTIKQGWERRERRKRDNPSPVKCPKENILSAFYKTFITITTQHESVKQKFLKKVRFLLNILVEFGIIQTAIENLECKIDQLGVSSL